MKIHYILHAPFEKLGAIREWAEQHNHSLTATAAYQHEPLPTPNEFDLLLLMGGPQSAQDLEHFPYLQHEVDLINAAVKANKHVLGICLGAQLIGCAFGANVIASPQKEVGIFPITFNESGQNDPHFKDFPDSLEVMHWHFDMIEPHSELQILAHSAGCPHQIIRFNQLTYGIQCHLEWTHRDALALIESAPEDLHQSRYTQTAEQILSANFDRPNTYLKKFLTRFTAECD